MAYTKPIVCKLGYAVNVVLTTAWSGKAAPGGDGQCDVNANCAAAEIDD